MRTPKVTDQALIESLVYLFSKYGYEGATLTRIAEATGLERASLYHRFPGGKEEMVSMVLETVYLWFQEKVLQPLRNSSSPEERIKSMASGLKEFYNFGKKSCLLDSLSFGEENRSIRKQIQVFFDQWIQALSQVFLDAGWNEDRSREKAEDCISRIQGGLVLSRGMQSNQPFLRIMDQLHHALKK